MVSQHLTYLIVHGASASEHIIDLTCNVTSQEQLIEEFFVIDTTLTNLVTMDTAKVKICF